MADLCGRILLALRQGRGVRIVDHRSDGPGARDTAFETLADITGAIARSPGTLAILRDDPAADLVVVIIDGEP